MTHPQLERALRDGRLYWRVTDQHGRSCNGGKQIRLDPPTADGPGAWAAPVDGEIRICSRGYHATTDPIRWAGCRVWLVEVARVLGRVKDKIVCRTLRVWAEVDPEACVDVRIWVACQRPNLRWADLSGAYLGWADLRGANLRGADLGLADLSGSYLGSWDLGPDGLARRRT